MKKSNNPPTTKQPVVLLLLAGGFAFGQKGEIVYTEYEPPVYVHYIGSDGVYDTIYFDIDLNGLPAGLYFVNITDSDGRMCVRKVVKQ